MYKFECIICKHKVKSMSKERPPGITWDDKHTCMYVLVDDEKAEAEANNIAYRRGRMR